MTLKRVFFVVFVFNDLGYFNSEIRLSARITLYSKSFTSAVLFISLQFLGHFQAFTA